MMVSSLSAPFGTSTNLGEIPLPQDFPVAEYGNQEIVVGIAIDLADGFKAVVSVAPQSKNTPF